MIRYAILLLLLLSFAVRLPAQNINIGKRDSVTSTILNSKRALSVYLPPSYYISNQQKFPVLYILDGDYNFTYVAGLLELQAGIAEFMPEAILVALSAEGTDTYRRNCKPAIAGGKDNGNADSLALFFEKELIPYIDSNYKTAPYKILAGHSVGGLFVINTALKHPKLFNNYIAISPALWWSDNAIIKIAKAQYQKAGYTEPNVYVSLANEQGMGVEEFLSAVTASVFKNPILTYGVGILFVLIALFWAIRSKKVINPMVLALIGICLSLFLIFSYYPTNKNYQFKKFPEENHNSVGLPTYRWALADIFKDWYVKEEFFPDAAAMAAHYEKARLKYKSDFNIPTTVLGNTWYTLQEDSAALHKVKDLLGKLNPNALISFNSYGANKLLSKDNFAGAEILLREGLAANPNSFEAYYGLAKLNVKINKALADSFINKAIALAEMQQLRQWQLNELLEAKKTIEELK